MHQLPLSAAENSSSIMMSGDGVFFTEQGEGPTMGEPAVFLRTNECNLDCNFCDTPYTWDKSHPGYKEKSRWTIEKTFEAIMSATKGSCDRLVLTGGEPLLQQDQLAALCQMDPLKNWNIEIETNGTRVPTSFYAQEKLQINCSPKLSSSGVQSDLRFRPPVLAKLARHYQTYFKFVASTEADVREIEEIFMPIFDNNLRPPYKEFPRDHIYVSPEGTDVKTIDAVQDRIGPITKHLQFVLSDRRHIRLHGNKRRT